MGGTVDINRLSRGDYAVLAGFVAASPLGFCGRCGAQFAEDDAKFCARCGGPRPATGDTEETR
jgi:predicted amidophosphoribosyltransferase